MKKLPKVYQNNINKKITNNKEVCYLKNETKQQEQKNEINKISIEETLNEIFNGLGYSYNIPVKITTTTKVYETNLIAKTKNNLITLDNEIIPMEQVQSIEKIKN